MGERRADPDRERAAWRARGHVRLPRARGDVDVASLFEARRPGMGGGSKIGLYVARRVAEAQGGRVSGDIVDGRLTLLVELPTTDGEPLGP